MPSARRPLRRAFLVTFLLIVSTGLFAAEKPRIQVDDYVIDAELQPGGHKLVARAKIRFTALDDISVATFELHNALRPTKVTDANGKSIEAERNAQDGTIRVSLPAGLSKGQSTTLTIDYEGVLNNADESPVQGLKLAIVSDDNAYLLYAGRWFPMVGYGTNRFTATMNITVPANWFVIGSGKLNMSNGAPPAIAEKSADQESAPALRKRAAPATAPRSKTTTSARSGNTRTYTYTFDKAAFPGTIVAGVFEQSVSNLGGMTLTAYYHPGQHQQISEYLDTAAKEFNFFSALWGPPLTVNLRLVQLPDDTLPATWATEVIGMSGHAMAGKVNYRLLANMIAHQWWGSTVSPDSKNSWWLSDGLARFSEARYVEEAAGRGAYEEVSKDIDVGALAYDTVPLSGLSRLDTFSPEFQSLATDKGAAIMTMLRWVMGDDSFHKTLAQFVQQYKGKTVTVEDFQKIAEQNYGDNLRWFFTQWIDSTGAPEFKTKYTVYRLGGPPCTDPKKCKGFRIVGEVSQDLDLFRMPIDVKVDTDGRSEDERIDVVGTDSAFTIETFGRPRRISLDPDNHVLKNSPDLKLRAAILRGQGFVQQGDYAQALDQFNKALEVNKNSSLAHYRIAEVFFLQKNYQSAANAYRESLNGDGEPKWTEVWSYIQLGKIFDITGQRERAVNEYRQALQTNDNTSGAQAEAQKYMQQPYDPGKNSNGM
ncbi:MAG TPA: M1 family aminopeptidase [Terriglobales bacterium]|nr:M1 family aminopeptidase [Terriglobales bacterium]